MELVGAQSETRCKNKKRDEMQSFLLCRSSDVCYHFIIVSTYLDGSDPSADMLDSSEEVAPERMGTSPRSADTRVRLRAIAQGF